MVLFESVQLCLHDIALTLALFKSDQIDLVIEPKLHDRLHKGVSHLCHLTPARWLLGRDTFLVWLTPPRYSHLPTPKADCCIRPRVRLLPFHPRG
jgi:hypothetical protein